MQDEYAPRAQCAWALAGLSAPVLQAITQRAGAHAARRAGEERKTGLVVFSRVYGLSGETETAKELLNQWKTT